MNGNASTQDAASAVNRINAVDVSGTITPDRAWG